MVINKKIVFFLLPFFIFQCNLEKEPIEKDVDKQSTINNRVAIDPEFRKGTWVNIRATSPAPDTIIFHDDTIWSNYNEYGGIYNEKYDFLFIQLRIYNNYLGDPLDNPISKQTLYNDTTGVFSVLDVFNQSIQRWNHYIKLD